MPTRDKPVRPRPEARSTPPSAPVTTGAAPAQPEAPLGDKPVAPSPGELLVPAAIAVGTGGVILAVAIAWGAAEAAVAVGAAYLVYSAAAGHGDLAGPLASRLITGVLRRPTGRTAEDVANRGGR